MGVSSDFSDFTSLVAKLESAPAEVGKFITRSVTRSAVRAKEFWQKDADRTGLSGYAKAVDFDVTVEGNTVTAEVGPNQAKRQGTFGLVEEGGPRVKSAPQFSGRAAIEHVQDDLEQGLLKALDDALGV